MLRATPAGLLRARTGSLLQKKGAGATAANPYLAGASKTGSEEKWGQAAMEYIYEKNSVNDARKRLGDVRSERRLAEAFDRFLKVNEVYFEARIARLTDRMSESLRELQRLGLDDCLDEALLLNAEQPPGNYRRPSLSPPLPGYEPGFGLDVPQLKNQQNEYPAVVRPTDTLQFAEAGGVAASSRLAFAEAEETPEGGSSAEHGSWSSPDGGADESASFFPYVDAHQIEDLTSQCAETLERIHGEIRTAAPLTGVEGEGWEAYVALQKKALARQKLILDLGNDPEFSKRYASDASLRMREWERRGMLPLAVESDEGGNEGGAEQQTGDPLRERWAQRALPTRYHFAQTPAYQPFRES